MPPSQNTSRSISSDRHVLNAFVAVSALAIMMLSIGEAVAVTIDWVVVGDAGNVADATGYGAVSYEYQIGKYPVSLGQYAAFLNAVAKEDLHGLYRENLMANQGSTSGIARFGSPGSFFYTVIGPNGSTQIPEATAANRPLDGTNWFGAARFANWMSNGQPTGPQGPTTTEDGSYSLSGRTSGTAPSVNAINPNTGSMPLYRIPTEDEWYKAAYYKGGGENAGYWVFATQSDSQPGNTPGSQPNQANFYNGVYAVTQSINLLANQNYLTDVGAFTGSPSAYGTFDQSGNIQEINDLLGIESTSRGLRGGSWRHGWADLSSFVRFEESVSTGVFGGFRLASPVPVPEPSTWVMGMAGIAIGSWRLWRRRRRR